MGTSKRNRLGYLFIAPFFIIYLVFTLYPMVYSIGLSFNEMDPISGNLTFVGLRHYKRLIDSNFFFDSIKNTIIIWSMSIVPQLTIAFILSLLLHNAWFKGRSIFRNVYYFPNLVTPVTVGLLFQTLFAFPSGAINQILQMFGAASVDFQHNPWLARLVISIAIAWSNFGYNIIYFTAGLHSISKDIYEAADVDGVNAFQKVIYITLPVMRPMVLYVLLTSVIGGLQIFDIAHVIFKDVPQNATTTMVKYMYESAFGRMQFGFGAAVSVGIFIVILVATGIVFLLTNLKPGSGKSRKLKEETSY